MKRAEKPVVFAFGCLTQGASVDDCIEKGGHFFVKIYARACIRQNSTVGSCRIYPNGGNRIDRKPHISKKAKRGGRYTLNRIFR